MSEFEQPDLSDMSSDDLCAMMLGCGMSNDPSDQAFVKACRDELAKRKPETNTVEPIGNLAKAVKSARGGDAPTPMQRFA